MLELQKTFSVFFSLNISKSADKNGWEGGGGERSVGPSPKPASELCCTS